MNADREAWTAKAKPGKRTSDPGFYDLPAVKRVNTIALSPLNPFGPDDYPDRRLAAAELTFRECVDFRRRPEPDTSPLGLALYRRAAAWIGFTFDAQSMETNPVKTRLGARELFHGADMPARFLQNPITFRIQKVIGVLVCLQLTPAEEEELCLWAGGNARHVWSLSTEDCPWHPGVTRPYLVTPTFHAPGGALSVQWIDPPMAEWRIEHFDHVPADPDGLGL